MNYTSFSISVIMIVFQILKRTFVFSTVSLLLQIPLVKAYGQFITSEGKGYYTINQVTDLSLTLYNYKAAENRFYR